MLFLPFGVKDMDGYAYLAKEWFQSAGFHLISLHMVTDGAARLEKIKTAEVIFIGEGNIYRILKALLDGQMLEPIRKRVLIEGVPFIGCDSGAVLSATTIVTTNDMPIIYVTSLEGLQLVPFNINTNYIDPDPNSTHIGKNREQRLVEFLAEPHPGPVLALREGCMLRVEGKQGTAGLTAILKGWNRARLFCHGQKPKECEPGTDLCFLFA